jgi:hypothetical protein
MYPPSPGSLVGEMVIRNKNPKGVWVKVQKLQYAPSEVYIAARSSDVIYRLAWPENCYSHGWQVISSRWAE